MERFKAFRAGLRFVGRGVYLMGRHPNRKALAAETGISHSRLRESVPHKYATSFDVYWR
jgi:hypothetical protein